MRAKKVIVGVAISAMLISSSIPVMAFSVTNGNKTFDKKWELSTASDGGKGVLILLLLMKIMHTHIIQLKIITHMSRMEMVLFRVQMLVKVIGLKLRLLIKEIVLPTVIATKQRFGIMAEWLEFQPLFFVECI